MQDPEEFSAGCYALSTYAFIKLSHEIDLVTSNSKGFAYHKNFTKTEHFMGIQLWCNVKYFDSINFVCVCADFP